MEHTLDILTSLLPANIDLASMLRFILIFSFATVFVGLLGRVIFGIRSDLNHALSSAVGILFVYALTIVIYTFAPLHLAQYLAPLPFVTFSGTTLHLFSFTSASFPAICSQILSMLILAFLVNLLDSLIPKGKKILHWYLLRFLTVLIAIALHILVSWACETYLPGVLVMYAPIILVVVLVSLLLLGLSKVLLGLVLTVMNPIIGALYTFFFATIIGKQLSKSAFTTLVMCVLLYVLEHFGFAVISIAAAALLAYLPLVLVLLILWYLIGHVL